MWQATRNGLAFVGSFSFVIAHLLMVQCGGIVIIALAMGLTHAFWHGSSYELLVFAIPILGLTVMAALVSLGDDGMKELSDMASMAWGIPLICLFAMDTSARPHVLAIIGVIGWAIVGLALLLAREERPEPVRVAARSSGASDIPTQASLLSVDPRFVAQTPRHRFADVVGMADLKTRLKKAGADIVQSIEQTTEEPRNGILLYGAPGNGKTFFAEALAGELGLKLVQLRYGDVASHWVNQTTEGVGAAFISAALQAPCVLFIDEFDSFVIDRANEGRHSGGEAAQTVNTLLTALVDIREHPVVVVAATNYLDRLDKAAIREGRFDYKIEITAPDREARVAVIKQGLSTLKLAARVDAIDRAAQRWHGFSVARIRTVMREAGDLAKERGIGLANFELFQESLRRLQGITQRIPEDTPTLDALMMDTRQRDILLSIAARMKHIDELEKMGGTVPAGLLFYGPSGTGKTLTARSLAKTSGWAFIPTSGADLLADPKRIDVILAEAADVRPAIIFIDEADDVLADRDGLLSNRAMTNKILSAMDGATGKVPDVVFIAATNHAESMDAAALRGGRFTEKILFALPTRDVIVGYIEHWVAAQRPNLAEGFCAQQAADLLNGQSIANIKEVLQSAINIMAGRRLAGDKTAMVDVEVLSLAYSQTVCD